MNPSPRLTQSNIMGGLSIIHTHVASLVGRNPQSAINLAPKHVRSQLQVGARHASQLLSTQPGIAMTREVLIGQLELRAHHFFVESLASA